MKKKILWLIFFRSLPSFDTKLDLVNKEDRHVYCLLFGKEDLRWKQNVYILFYNIKNLDSRYLYLNNK